MAKHWTYEEAPPGADLVQGDILKVSDDLRTTFEEVHPHFCDCKYSGFLVATQTCDLVRREGRPAKAAYINVAAIRPLDQVASKLIGVVTRPVGDTCFRSSDKEKARQLFERLFDQNEQNLGLFFLHEDSDCGVDEHSVAFLRVTVALRRDHYDKLVASRMGRLNAEFRAKLGWLLGNLYNRPATPDWTDSPGGRAKLQELIHNSVCEQVPGRGPRWIDDVIVKEALKKNLDPALLNEQQQNELRPRSAFDQAWDQINTQLSRVAPELDVEIRRKLKNRLDNDGVFKRLLVIS